MLIYRTKQHILKTEYISPRYLWVSKSSGGSRENAESQNFCITVFDASLDAPGLLSTYKVHNIETGHYNPFNSTKC